MLPADAFATIDAAIAEEMDDQRLADLLAQLARRVDAVCARREHIERILHVNQQPMGNWEGKLEPPPTIKLDPESDQIPADVKQKDRVQFGETPTDVIDNPCDDDSSESGEDYVPPTVAVALESPTTSAPHAEKPKPKTFACDYARCAVAFATLSGLRLHKSQAEHYTAADACAYACADCGALRHTLKALCNHIRGKHRRPVVSADLKRRTVSNATTVLQFSSLQANQMPITAKSRRLRTLVLAADANETAAAASAIIDDDDDDLA